MPQNGCRRPVRRTTLTLALAAAMAAPPAVAQDLLLPSSARWPGFAGAFFTTDVCVANLDTRDTTVTLRFRRHDENGSFGPEVSRRLGAGEALTVADVLKGAFGFSLDWGAIHVSADTPHLALTSQTSTRAGDEGTMGQSVPGFSSAMLVRRDAPGTIAGIRQGGGSRTNLVLSNAIDDQIVVHADLFGPDGSRLGEGRDFVLPPFGMTQATLVVEQLAGSGSTVDGGRIRLTTSGPDGAVAAYAAVIDDVTNDPRTILPTTRPEPARTWIVPSSAHAPGAQGAFFTTDLTLANTGAVPALVSLRFLGHDEDGTLGPRRDVEVGAGVTLRLRDVLGGLFGLQDGWGAILVTADSPDLAVVSETSTPAPGGGTFGQSVPAVPASSFAGPGTTRWLGGIRHDASFRTNLVLANPTDRPVTVRVDLSSGTATPLGSRTFTVPPLGMTQVTRVVERFLGAGATLSGGQVLLSTPTPGGAFVTYAAVIDNVTNDPRTLLP